MTSEIPYDADSGHCRSRQLTPHTLARAALLCETVEALVLDAETSAPGDRSSAPGTFDTFKTLRRRA
jgi:hypothetical protein